MTQARAQMNPLQTPLAKPATCPGLTSVRVRWRVSRGALSRAMPGVIAAGRPGQNAVLEIVATLESAGWQASASLIDPRLRTTHQLEIDHGRVTVSRVDGLMHVDVDRLINATFRESDGQALFARTPVFEQLGLPGGRYELDSASID